MQKNTSKKYIYVANWKMSLSFAESLEYAAQCADAYEKRANSTLETVVICPTMIALFPLSKIFQGLTIKLGAQDCSDHAYGSFTGQTSAQSIHEVGAGYCIIGHSERRLLCGETSEIVAKKFNQLIKFHISPIVCVGETIEEHKKGLTLQILAEQLNPILDIIKTKQAFFEDISILIAYEPVWAIGGDAIPDSDHLKVVAAFIHQSIISKIDNVSVKLLYGGSVTSLNSGHIKKIHEFDGLLIGRASTTFDEFEKIIKS